VLVVKVVISGNDINIYIHIYIPCICHVINNQKLPVVPRKAVAEVSKIGNL